MRVGTNIGVSMPASTLELGAINLIMIGQSHLKQWTTLSTPITEFNNTSEEYFTTSSVLDKSEGGISVTKTSGDANTRNYLVDDSAYPTFSLGNVITSSDVDDMKALDGKCILAVNTLYSEVVDGDFSLSVTTKSRTKEALIWLIEYLNTELGSNLETVYIYVFGRVSSIYATLDGDDTDAQTAADIHLEIIDEIEYCKHAIDLTKYELDNGGVHFENVFYTSMANDLAYLHAATKSKIQFSQPYISSATNVNSLITCEVTHGQGTDINVVAGSDAFFMIQDLFGFITPTAVSKVDSNTFTITAEYSPVGDYQIIVGYGMLEDLDTDAPELIYDNNVRSNLPLKKDRVFIDKSMPTELDYINSAEDLQFVIDAESSIITHTTGVISSISDLSGNGHAADAPATMEPTTGAATLNGNNLISFSNAGVPDLLKISFFEGLRGPFSVYFAGQCGSGAGTQNLITEWLSGNDRRWAIQYDGVNIKCRYSENGAGSTASNAITISPDEYVIFGMIYDGTDITIVDDTATVVLTIPNINLYVCNSAFAIGGIDGDPGTGAYNGNIGTVCRFGKAHSLQEQKDILGWLKRKWGI